MLIPVEVTVVINPMEWSCLLFSFVVLSCSDCTLTGLKFKNWTQKEDFSDLNRVSRPFNNFILVLFFVLKAK